MRILFFLSWLRLSALAVPAQTKPETLTNASVIALHKAGVDDALIVAKIEADQKTKAKGLFGGYTVNLELPSKASTVKLPAGDSHSFLLSLGDGMGEPSAFYGLYRAEIKKGKRTAVWVQGKTGQAASGEGIITFSSKSAGDKAFEIIPNQKLEKGQYFFVNKGSALTYGGQGYEAFAFAVE